MEIFEQFKPVKPGYFNWEIELVNDKGEPVPEADAKVYWAEKYGIDTYNEGIEAAVKLADELGAFDYVVAAIRSLGQ